MTETTKHRSRFIRDTKNIPRVKPQPGDVLIFKYIADYRAMTTEQLAKLLPRGKPALEKRLQKLWLNGYLERGSLDWYFGEGTQKALHLLGKKAVDPLVQAYDKNRNRIRKQAEHNETRKRRNHNHTFMISYFRSCSTLAIRQSKHLEFIDLKDNDDQPTTWIPDRGFKDTVIIQVKKKKEGKKILVNLKQPVEPDSFFGILNTSLPEGRQKKYFVLEADQNTENLNYFILKYKALYQYWKQKKYTPRLGIKNFRVLTIAPDEERSERLRHAVMEYITKANYLFYFTHETQYNLDNPTNLLKPIWRITLDPNDKKAQELLRRNPKPTSYPFYSLLD